MGNTVLKKQKIDTFEAAEAYLYDTPKFTAKNSIEDTKKFLERLGNPERQLKIIHVAGTNGSGSVCAYMRSILEAAGYSVAVFTSPHLTDIRERFTVCGEMISEEDFLGAFLHIYDMLDWDAAEAGEGMYHPTFFEYLFFMAMLLFPEAKPDYCILETGLGGRLDATNAVSCKELSVITRIGLDHVEYLGETLDLIAGEKAGIMQKSVPAVYWDTCEETTRVFREKAAELGISAHEVSKNAYRFLNFKQKTIDFSLYTGYYGVDDLELTLHTIATYQAENCALAVRAISVLDSDKRITPEQIQRGVSACFWAGRMEEVLPEVYVDGAHNADGIRAFLETVRKDGHNGTRGLLFGVVREKDYEHMARELIGSGLFERFAVARMQTGRAVDTSLLAAIFEEYPDCSYEVYDSVAAAFKELVHSRKESERLYAAGSLYLVGEIKELLENDQF